MAMDEFQNPAMEKQAKLQATVQTSPCWARGKEIFLLSLLASKKPPHKTEIDEFMSENGNLDGTISTCQKLKTKADDAYTKHASDRFLGKLMNTLSIIKDVADPFLEFAPESVSLAWFAISALIQIGATDMENTELIFEACNNIANILLTCRLYESRYQESPKSELDHGIGSVEVERKIIGAIPDTIALILDFSWHVRLTLKKNKFVRALKETFSPKVREKVEAIDSSYLALRQIANDAFQERIMDSIDDLRQNLQHDREHLRSVMFPALEDIRRKLDGIAVIAATLEESKLRSSLQQSRETLRPSKTHVQQLHATFDPVARYADNICEWLFTDDHYKVWEDVEDSPGAKEKHHENIVKIYGEQLSGENGLSIPNLFYVQARPGFGKSVTLASVIRRLSNRRDAIICYFFFKAGDENTQNSLKALTSLATQLYDDKHASNEAELMKLLSALEKMTSTASAAVASGKNSSNAAIFTSDMLRETIKNVGAALSRRIYLIVDGIDECVDHEKAELVPYFSELAEVGNFKVMISSRENKELENFFSDTTENESEEEKRDGEDQKTPSGCILTKKAVILNITEERNSDDMESFLRASLERIMMHRSKGSTSKAKNQKETARIIQSIKQKANGMFTYAAIVIASLEQPSPLTLSQKLKNLPSGMDDLYRQRLEALNLEEKRLIVAALKFVVWGQGNVRTFEIAEHFKKIYDTEDEDCVEDANAARTTAGMDGNDDSEDGVEADDSKSTTLDSSKQLGQYDPMTDPEVAETVYHLTKAGRDFFKFSNGQRDIDVVHKTVRDWVENESTKITDWYKDVGAAGPKLNFNERGELNVTLPMPPGFIGARDGISVELQAERDAHLDIAIQLLTALTHPKFIERYIGDVPPRKPWPIKEDSLINAEDSDQAANINETFDYTEHSSKDTKEPAQKEDRTASEPGIKATTESSFGEAVEPKSDMAESEEKKTPKFAHTFSFRDEPKKKEFRYELCYLGDHIERLEELWPKPDRKGPKWDLFWQKFTKFASEDYFRCYNSQLLQLDDGYTVKKSWEEADKITILHAAASQGSTMLVEYLLVELKADPNAINNDNYTPIFLALDYPEVVELLLQHGADYKIEVDNLDVFGQVLRQFWFEGWLRGVYPPPEELEEVCKLIIEAGVDVNEPVGLVSANSKTTALHVAVSAKSKKLFDILMKQPKINVDATDSIQATPLSWVHMTLNTTLYDDLSKHFTKTLLEAGANPNHQDVKSSGPLARAVFAQDKDSVELLLQYGADPNDDTSDGDSVIHIAAASVRGAKRDVETNVAILRLLLMYGAEIDRESSEGDTPLLWCCVWGYEKTFKILIEQYEKKYGEDHSYLLKKQGKKQKTYFKSAASNYEAGFYIMKYLVEKMTKEQLQDMISTLTAEGQSALHRGVQWGSIETVGYLFDIGMDPFLKSKRGTILDHCFDQHVTRNKSMAAYSKVMMTSQKRIEEMILFVLDKFPGLPAVSDQNIGWAIIKYNEKIISKLVECGEDIERVDEHGWGGFEFAHACQHLDSIKLLPGFSSWQSDSDRKPRVTKIPTRLVYASEKSLFKIEDNGLDFEIIVDDPYSIQVVRYGEVVPTHQIQADHPVPAHESVFYWEVRFQKSLADLKPDFAIGYIASKPGEKNIDGPGQILGIYDGFGLSAPGDLLEPRLSKETFSNNEGRRYITTQGPLTISEGDTVGCGLSVNEGVIFYTLNGTYLGVAFEDVWGRWFPAISGAVSFRGTANFGGEPFLFEEMNNGR